MVKKAAAAAAANKNIKVIEIQKISRNDETTTVCAVKNKNQLIFGRQNVQ